MLETLILLGVHDQLICGWGIKPWQPWPGAFRRVALRGRGSIPAQGLQKAAAAVSWQCYPSARFISFVDNWETVAPAAATALQAPDGIAAVATLFDLRLDQQKANDADGRGQGWTPSI